MMQKPTTTVSQPAVTAPASVWSALRELSRVAGPQEACGALMGHCEYGVSWDIRMVLAVPNAAASPQREYLIPASVVRSLERAAAEAGLQLAGFFHSHPHGSAQPSATDRECAWPGYLYAILDAMRGGVRFWTLDVDRAELIEVLAAGS